MKIYKKEVVEDKQVYFLMHWDYDMRSFQVNDKVVLIIQDIYSYIHPDWKNRIKGVETQFLEFLNQKPYSWEVESINEIIPYIEELIEAKELEYCSTEY